MKFLVLYICLFLSACEGFQGQLDNVDEWVFSRFGRTLLARPALVTSKELHFDEGSLSGSLVLFRGVLAEKGNFDSYMVLNDDGGRVLVVLTHVEIESVLEELPMGLRVDVLGSAERGKKGLPFILAKSLRFQSEQ